jgi:disease resistance protein RPM1
VLQHPTFPKIEEGALPFLESLQLLCKDMDGLSGIQIKGFTRLREVTLDIRVNNGTKVNWVRVAKEHPNKPKVLLLKTPVPTEVYLGGASASFGTTENGIVNCSVLPEGQVQETDTQMPHDEPNSVFSNIGHPVVCAAGSSIAGNGTMAS